MFNFYKDNLFIALSYTLGVLIFIGLVIYGKIIDFIYFGLVIFIYLYSKFIY